MLLVIGKKPPFPGSKFLPTVTSFYFCKVEWDERRKAGFEDRLNDPQLQTGKENSVKDQTVTDPPVTLCMCFQIVPKNRDPQLGRR